MGESRKTTFKSNTKTLKFSLEVRENEFPDDPPRTLDKILTTRRRLNHFLLDQSVCQKDRFILQFLKHENFNGFHFIEGIIFNKETFPRTLPQKIEEANGSILLLSKIGQGGRLSKALKLEHTVHTKKKRNAWAFNWMRNIPPLVGRHIKKIVKNELYLTEKRFFYINEHIKESEMCSMDILSILSTPLKSFSDLYKRTSQKPVSGLILLHIFIDLFDDAGKLDLHYWIKCGKFKPNMREKLWNDKGRIQKKFTEVRKDLQAILM